MEAEAVHADGLHFVEGRIQRPTAQSEAQACGFELISRLDRCLDWRDPIPEETLELLPWGDSEGRCDRGLRSITGIPGQITRLNRGIEVVYQLLELLLDIGAVLEIAGTSEIDDESDVDIVRCSPTIVRFISRTLPVFVDEAQRRKLL